MHSSPLPISGVRNLLGAFSAETRWRLSGNKKWAYLVNKSITHYVTNIWKITIQYYFGFSLDHNRVIFHNEMNMHHKYDLFYFQIFILQTWCRTVNLKFHVHIFNLLDFYRPISDKICKKRQGNFWETCSVHILNTNKIKKREMWFECV